MNAFASGFAGLIIGAGMGAMTMKVLSDKKTRNILLDRFNEAKERVTGYAQRISKQAQRTGAAAEHRIRAGRR